MYQIPLYFQKVLSPFTDILYGVENSDKVILKTIERLDMETRYFHGSLYFPEVCVNF